MHNVKERNHGSRHINVHQLGGCGLHTALPLTLSFLLNWSDSLEQLEQGMGRSEGSPSQSTRWPVRFANRAWVMMVSELVVVSTVM